MNLLDVTRLLLGAGGDAARRLDAALLPVGGLRMIVLLWLATMNLLAFTAYWSDKRRAERNQWRIPEAKLLWLAALGGSPGALAAMYLFHHKTKKPRFSIGVPVMCAVQTGIVIGWMWGGK